MRRSIRTGIDGWPREVFDGGVYRSRFPGAPLVVGDPGLAAEILIERSDDFPHGELLNGLFTPIWGRGIFVAEGAEWRWQRRAAAPAFRSFTYAKQRAVATAKAAPEGAGDTWTMIGRLLTGGA